MIKKLEPLLDYVPYKALRITLLILLIAYTYWGVTVFQKAGMKPWNKVEQHLAIHTDGAGEFWNYGVEYNRDDEPKDTLFRTSSSSLKVTYTDGEGSELNVESIKEEQGYRHIIHLAEPLVPGASMILSSSGSLEQVAKKKGDVWQYTHYPSFGRYGRVAQMLTLPENATLVSISPEPEHMFIQQNKLTMRFYWDDPSKCNQGVKVQYKLMEEYTRGY